MKFRKWSCQWSCQQRWNPGGAEEKRLPLSPLGRAACLIGVFWFFCPLAGAQSNAGQLDVVLRGYALGQQDQASFISGPSLQFSEFFEGRGLLRGQFEAFGRNASPAYGSNYLEFRGLSRFNLRWNLRAGDFRVASRLVENPFQNLFYPDIAARGFLVEADRPGWRLALFGGPATLPEGPRIPFRRIVPQTVWGASVQRNVGDRWQIGLRTLHLSSNPQALEEYPALFPLHRRIERSTSLAVQSSFALTGSLRLYGEGSAALTHSAASQAGGKISGVAGVAFENPIWTFKLNYTRQTASYLPLLGYLLGDRRGPFGEVRFRPRAWIDLFASSNSYSSNVQQDIRLPVFRSRSNSAGTSFRLPWRLNLTGQMSNIRFASSNLQTGAVEPSETSQLSLNLARPVLNHTLRAGYRELRLRSIAVPTLQRAMEAEDTIRFKWVAAGGGARLQQTTGVRRTNSVYLRGFLQIQAGPVTGFAQFENGNDLLNRTLFATSNFRTMMAGATARLWSGWDLHVEAFRNRLTTELHPENAFVQAGQGIAPQPVLSGFNQRSVYFQLSKRIQWGEAVPADGLDGYAEVQTRLQGEVRGTVRSLGVGPPLPAAGVGVSLDGGPSVQTDRAGRFLIPDVTVGSHVVTLAERGLPADFDPGPTFEATVLVTPGGIAAATLDVWRLGSLSGSIVSLDPKCRAGIRLRLFPSGRYTTTNTEGRFLFANLREGEYDVSVDGLAESNSCAFDGPDSQHRDVRAGTPTPPAEFRLHLVEEVKPVRVIVLEPEP